MPKGAMLGCDPSRKALSYRERGLQQLLVTHDVLGKGM